MFLAVAEAATAGGVEVGMNTMVSLVIALAGIGLIGAIAWRGVQFLMARDYSHMTEAMIGLGVGGGMIAACRPLAALILGGAVASPLGPVLPMADGVADLVSIALAWGPVVVAGSRAWLRISRHGG